MEVETASPPCTDDVPWIRLEPGALLTQKTIPTRADLIGGEEYVGVKPLVKNEGDPLTLQLGFIEVRDELPPAVHDPLSLDELKAASMEVVARKEARDQKEADDKALLREQIDITMDSKAHARLVNKLKWYRPLHYKTCTAILHCVTIYGSPVTVFVPFKPFFWLKVGDPAGWSDTRVESLCRWLNVVGETEAESDDAKRVTVKKVLKKDGVVFKPALHDPSQHRRYCYLKVMCPSLQVMQFVERWATGGGGKGRKYWDQEKRSMVSIDVLACENRLKPPQVFLEEHGLTYNFPFTVNGWTEASTPVLTHAHAELYLGKNGHIQPLEQDDVGVFPILGMGMDIEAYSSVGESDFVNPERPGDEAYLICVSLTWLRAPKHLTIPNETVVYRFALTTLPCPDTAPNDPDRKDPGIHVLRYDTERDLLDAYRDLLVAHVMVDGENSWNGFSFDNRFLAMRAKYRKCIKFQFRSRFRGEAVEPTVKEMSSNAMGSVEFWFLFPERYIMDQLFWDRSNKKRASYRLDYVSNKELGTGKTPIKVHHIFGGFETRHPHDAWKLAVYCATDADLPVQLSNKCGSFNQQLAASSVTMTSFYVLNTSGKQVTVLNQLKRFARERDFILNNLYEDTYASKGSYGGGYVYTPKPHLYRYDREGVVICLDFASLYPSIIRAYNIDPSTWVGSYDRSIHAALCPDDSFWKKHAMDFIRTGDSSQPEPYWVKKVEGGGAMFGAMTQQRYHLVKALQALECPLEEVVVETLVPVLLPFKKDIWITDDYFLAPGGVHYNFVGPDKPKEEVSFTGQRTIATAAAERAGLVARVPKEEQFVVHMRADGTHEVFPPGTKDIVLRSHFWMQKRYQNGNKDVDWVRDGSEGVAPSMQAVLKSQRNACKKVLKAAKKEGDDALAAAKDAEQLAVKVSMNSGYGALGVKTGFLPFAQAAESITARGRQLLRMCQDYVEANYKPAHVVYGDTDSIMVLFPNTHWDPVSATKLCEEVIQNQLTALFRAPVEQEYEKTYLTFLPRKSKMYDSILVQSSAEVQAFLDGDMQYCIEDSKGNVESRRDGAGLARLIRGDMRKALFDLRSDGGVQAALDVLVDHCNSLLANKFELDLYVMTASYQKAKVFHTTNPPPQKVLAEAGIFDFVSGDRVGFVKTKKPDPAYVPYIVTQSKTTRKKMDTWQAIMDSKYGSGNPIPVTENQFYSESGARGVVCYTKTPLPRGTRPKDMPKSAFCRLPQQVTLKDIDRVWYVEHALRNGLESFMEAVAKKEVRRILDDCVAKLRAAEAGQGSIMALLGGPSGPPTVKRIRLA